MTYEYEVHIFSLPVKYFKTMDDLLEHYPDEDGYIVGNIALYFNDEQIGRIYKCKK